MYGEGRGGLFSFSSGGVGFTAGEGRGCKGARGCRNSDLQYQQCTLNVTRLL